jgi:uncharacterized membrane protein YeaQ/YmgE (transglycosylase-associated protein family)
MLAKLLASKTTIVHVLTVAAGVIGYLAGSDVISQYPEIMSVAVATLGAINVVLHVFQPEAPAATK